MHTQTAVRRFRRSLRLSQLDLAALLDIDQSAVSRIEAGGTPEAEHVFALHILLNKSPLALFAGRYEMVGEALAARAAEFERRLQGRHGRGVAHKRAWLRDMISRITVFPA